MSNLLVEIGNTALKAAWSERMTLGKTFRYQGEKHAEFILSITKKEKPAVMLVSSVYPLSEEDIQKLSRECTSLVILDSNNRGELSRRGLPQHLSYDRAAAIIAARYIFKGRACTIVDFGTTISVDITGQEGNYLGGNLSLGCRTRFKALKRYSRSLPLVDTPSKVEPLGQSEIQSIESGVVQGIVFEIEGYLNKYEGNIIVFTGGDSNYFADKLKSSIFVISNLVLMGLALIADEYAQKLD